MLALRDLFQRAAAAPPRSPTPPPRPQAPASPPTSPPRPFAQVDRNNAEEWRNLEALERRQAANILLPRNPQEQRGSANQQPSAPGIAAPPSGQHRPGFGSNLSRSNQKSVQDSEDEAPQPPQNRREAFIQRQRDREAYYRRQSFREPSGASQEQNFNRSFAAPQQRPPLTGSVALQMDRHGNVLFRQRQQPPLTGSVALQMDRHGNISYQPGQQPPLTGSAALQTDSHGNVSFRQRQEGPAAGFGSQQEPRGFGRALRFQGQPSGFGFQQRQPNVNNFSNRAGRQSRRGRPRRGNNFMRAIQSPPPDTDKRNQK
ncbi:unnamed protein product [Caenorhabditis auriculariae]|uniref:Uncharacterized protein n=1 Tax=Caenorhabditis auriculariae TaxID=2777116 RepID=A0A8S1H020_9PELO|nr:unnamed protein product [Caenorhabditis auriculariae]